MYKENSTKSKLAHQLEAEATNTPLLGPFDKSSSVFIRDDMALLQSLNVQRFKTFTRYIDSFGAYLLSWDPSWCLTIDSPKNFKRACLLESTVMNCFQSGI
jgi:hypothetical protein